MNPYPVLASTPPAYLADSAGRLLKKVSKTIREHWDDVVAYLSTRVTNGADEAINGIIQTVKRKSRGFEAVEYMVAMICLVASRLTFDLPDPIPATHTKSY